MHEMYIRALVFDISAFCKFPSPPVSTGSRFYLLPKIDKPGNPGRPIIALNGAPPENISHFADFCLQPSVIHLPSYIRDTTDFINTLQRLPQLSPGCLLLTLDDSLLYTNIPHEEGITVCQEFLNHKEARTRVPADPGQDTSSVVEVQ